jgi:hypothetical protein
MPDRLRKQVRAAIERHNELVSSHADRDVADALAFASRQGVVRMAIAPSRLGQFIDRAFYLGGPDSDAALVRRLREAELVVPESSDEALSAAIAEARREHLELPEEAQMFNSPEERVRVFLERYLSKKGRRWAKPLTSLKLPNDE